jgi:hypothetical protein
LTSTKKLAKLEKIGTGKKLALEKQALADAGGSPYC